MNHERHSFLANGRNWCVARRPSTPKSGRRDVACCWSVAPRTMKNSSMFN